MEEGKLEIHLVLLGAPGTGKGTQGSLLANNLQIPKISSGDILRQHIQHNTKLGSEAKQYIGKGELVLDNLIIKIIKQRLGEDDCKNGFILDGFPRTVPQAEALDEFLSHKNKSIQFVILLDVDQKKIIERTVTRRVCRNCGKDYNINTNKPPDDLKCTICGGDIWQRPDDTIEIVSNRLKIYEQKTKLVKEYYEKKGLLKKIDGDRSVDEIKTEILDLISN